MPKKSQILEVDGREIPVSNLDKVLYPIARFTKGQVIDYYRRVSKYLLPHLQDRPITLKRFPDGVRGEFFYEKDAPAFTPKWVQTFPVPRREGRPDIRYILINDLPTLVWVANIATLEIHPFLHRAPRLQQPTAVVFDLDPGESADILTCTEVAFLVRDLMGGLGLKCFPKVSGSKGIQIYIPLNTTTEYKVTQPFAKAAADLLCEQHRNLVVSSMAKRSRAGKVFIDWSQNSDFKTTVAVYSLRAKSDRPFVSAPVSWDELAAAARAKNAAKLYFTPDETLRRLERMGDLFKPVLSLKQRLPEAVEQWGAAAGKSISPPPLEAYKKKRDFAKTAEPGPKLPRRSRQESRRRFVIQKHAASHLHYDFRLEMHDVLKSWAVPKGLPYETGTKRLAMAVEDHPLAYLEFEGIIPKGQYGGGTVMVWDIGTYELMEGNYFKGFLHIYLKGSKVEGEWTLARSQEEPGNKWFLTKVGSSMPALSPSQDDASALTGRSMEQIAQAADAQWQSNRPARPSKARKAVNPPSLQPGATSRLRSLPKATMEFVEPMLARMVAKVPEGPEWSYELKLDGFRCLVGKGEKDVTMFSRRGNRLNGQFPVLASAFKELPSGTMLDGEIVVMDKQGRPSFNALQNWRARKQPIFFYAFDLLAYEGKDVRRLPLSERRRLLEDFALRGLKDPIRLSPTLHLPAQDLVREAREEGLEGIVAKRLDSIYESGKRSGAWTKLKTAQAQELVIGGYIPGPHVFDSLLVGYYEKGKLMFLAKVRNGFVPTLRREVARHFRGLESDVCPFANLPEPKSARRGKALTKEFMSECRWLKPELVAQVAFADWTKANNLRQSSFVGLRDDKDPREVTHETAA